MTLLEFLEKAFPMSDAVKIQFITTFFGFVTTITMAAMAYFVKRLNEQQEVRSVTLNDKATKVIEEVNDFKKLQIEQADAAAIRAEQVKKTLEISTRLTVDKLANLTKVSKSTHSFVNSLMGEQLKQTAELSRWKANNTKLKVDIKAAENAERLLKEHMEAQKIVDAQPGTDAEKKGEGGEEINTADMLNEVRANTLATEANTLEIQNEIKRIKEGK